MKFGVIRFPGSCDETDAVLACERVPGASAQLLWHGDADLGGVEAIVVPGGFSYGDYLRVGAIARFSPVMESVTRFAREGGLVLGICNGFQVLCEAGLLPGALLPNAERRIICRQVDLEVAHATTPRRRGRKPNDVRFDATAKLTRALGVDVTAIEGIDAATALVILAEIGVDVARFPSEKHFASWLGLCPRTARSNKTEKRRTPRKGKNRVAQALRMAAQAVGRTQTALGVFYRRIKSRIGGRGAITATAHKLSRLVYRMLKFGTEYVAQSLSEYEAKVREKLERSLRRKAQALGYDLVPKGTIASAPS